MKEIKDNTNRWRDTLCPWIGRINVVKMTTVPRAIQCNPYEINTELEQKIS